MADDNLKVETKVALLERDNSRIIDLLERLDTSILRLTDVSASLKEMIAVQESRIDNHDNRNSSIERSIEKHGDRLDELEKWRWYLTGAVALVGFVVPILVNYLSKLP
jgi:predicted RNase H-like nuclease (RuvC/YqgF family)